MIIQLTDGSSSTRNQPRMAGKKRQQMKETRLKSNDLPLGNIPAQASIIFYPASLRTAATKLRRLHFLFNDSWDVM